MNDAELKNDFGALSKKAIEFVKNTQEAARKNFNNDKELRPVLLVVRDNKIEIVDLAEFMNNQNTKDMLAGVLGKLREDPLVEMYIMASEAWMSKEENDGRSLKDIPPPSENPNRKEVLNLNYFSREGCEMWFADIIRADDQAVVGPWLRVTTDGTLKGRFAEEDIPEELI